MYQIHPLTKSGVMAGAVFAGQDAMIRVEKESVESWPLDESSLFYHQCQCKPVDIDELSRSDQDEVRKIQKTIGQ